MNQTTQCTKCQGELEGGFMLDHNDVSAHQALWASGAPTRTVASDTGPSKTERMLPVVTFRCTKCGYLESFAPNSE
jgi:hypothetical protein